MPIHLTVRQVRDALFLQAGGREAAGDGRASTEMLGRFFHEVFAGLVDEQGTDNWSSALAEQAPDVATWRDVLRDHAYRRLVAPRLRRQQAALHDSAEQVCQFWEAVQDLCDWIVELLWTVYERRGRLPEPQSLVQSEYTLQLELREPGWTDAVQLAGNADAVWRVPDRDVWCVAELKLGKTHQQADLGQACLYHLMLQTGTRSAGPLALVSFKPHREERLFEATQLEAAQRELKALIGQLAGVTVGRIANPSGQSSDTSRQQKPRPDVTREVRIANPSNHSTDTLPQPEVALAFPAPPTPEHGQLGKRLIVTLREYGAPAELIGSPVVGPTFIQFRLTPARGVRVAKIVNLAEEIKVRLALQETPLIHSAAGRLVVEIQRPDRQVVPFDSIRSQLPRGDLLRGSSQAPLGIDLNGQLQFVDLAEVENCHVLVAGTTGSGKSQWLRAALAGLIAANTPQTLQLVLIDPKRNALSDFAGSPFLLEPLVYPDERPAVEAFVRLADEMDRRYREMGGAETLQQYVEYGGRMVPRIVCVCDEYFDLINRGPQVRKELEQQIFRLGAKARAAGIHLIIATQQPSRETIKGALDANIPARVALKMGKAIESRMMLGESGAEHLLGSGDLLFKSIGAPRRLQGVYAPRV